VLVVRWSDEAIPFRDIPYFTTTSPITGVCVARFDSPEGFGPPLAMAWHEVHAHLRECRIAALAGSPLPPTPAIHGGKLMTLEAYEEAQGDDYELAGLVEP
jgi:hypothetical protein